VSTRRKVVDWLVLLLAPFGIAALWQFAPRSLDALPPLPAIAVWVGVCLLPGAIAIARWPFDRLERAVFAATYAVFGGPGLVASVFMLRCGVFGPCDL